MSIDGSPLHRVLFRLAARAPHNSLEDMMSRVTTSVANHFAAVACSLHTDASGWAAAAAEPIRAMQKMERIDRARQETIEANLVKAAVRRQTMMSALDLEERSEIEAFLQRTLGVIDIFAFPLLVDGRVSAVLVLYLSLDSDPLSEADIHGLLSIGELLALTGTAAPSAT